MSFEEYNGPLVADEPKKGVPPQGVVANFDATDPTSKIVQKNQQKNKEGVMGIAPQFVAPAAIGAGAAAGAGGMYLLNKFKGGTPEATATADDLHQQALRAEELRSMKLKNDLLERQLNPVQQPATPAPAAPVVQPPAPPAQTNLSLQEIQQRAAQGVPPPVQTPPPAPSLPPQTAGFDATTNVVPSADPVERAVINAAKVEAVPELSGPQQPVNGPVRPVAPPEMAGPPVDPGPVKPAPKVRRTPDQMAAEKAALLAETPEGMRPVPPNPKYNKAPGEKIGVGGYTYAHGAFGDETQARWEEQYGKKNVPYEQVRKDISTAQMGPQPEGVNKEFKYTRPKFAPDYIKGAVKPEMLTSVLNKGNLAAALMTPTEAGAPTVEDYSKLQGGRGNVNPPPVDAEYSGKYAEFIKMMQGLFGDKTPYAHRNQ
jgi:hypothetical protein